MCELLALNFNIPIEPQLYLTRFFQRSIYNPHGWGIGFYPNEQDAAEVIKEPLNALKSRLANFLQVYPFNSKMFIAHVRFATEGNISFRNTHPFCREYRGRDYIFAHNGNLNENNYITGDFKPIGETDSENIFCFIMNWLKNISLAWTNENFMILKEKFQDINTVGHFNCLFSDGEYLFCYRDKDGYNGLCYIEKKPSIDNIDLFHNNSQIDIESEKSSFQKGYIIATHPLTDIEQWHSFEHGQLVVFKHGQIVFSC